MGLYAHSGTRARRPCQVSTTGTTTQPSRPSPSPFFPYVRRSSRDPTHPPPPSSDFEGEPHRTFVLPLSTLPHVTTVDLSFIDTAVDTRQGHSRVSPFSSSGPLTFTPTSYWSLPLSTSPPRSPSPSLPSSLLSLGPRSGRGPPR